MPDTDSSPMIRYDGLTDGFMMSVDQLPVSDRLRYGSGYAIYGWMDTDTDTHAVYRTDTFTDAMTVARADRRLRDSS